MRRAQTIFCLFAAAVMTGGCGGSSDAPDAGKAGAGADTKTLYVAHHLADCVGVGPMECMLVRDTPDGEWQLFYSQIEGFDYEPGYDYELRIRTEDIADPPADASSIRYILEELVSKTPMSDEAGAGADLVIGEWRLSSFSGVVLAEAGFDPAPMLERLAARGRGVTIVFLDDGKVGGYSGCNQYTGGYTIEGGHSLSFGPLAGTRKMCPPPLMELETLTLKTLAAVEGVYVRDSATLELFGADETLLATFEPAGGVAGPHVASWKLDEITPAALAGSGDEALAAVKSLSADETTTLTLNLGADSQASGFSGCNRYTGGYKSDARSVLEFGNLAVTMRACVGPGMAIESAYLKALGSVKRMQIVGSTLELLDADGTPLLMYSMAEDV